MNALELAARLNATVSPSGGWQARCPAHEDEHASLSLTEGRGGRVLLKCHAGCSVTAIVGALGLGLRDLFGNGPAKTIAAIYDYVDERGTLLFQVVRFTPKDFRQRRPDGAGGWVWSLKAVRRVLYRLPELVAGIAAGRRVYVSEGEKDVEAVRRAGQLATTNPGGAGKWREEYSETLKGADVVIIADRDEPGRAHAHAVARALARVAANVAIVEPAEGKDVTEHLASGRTLGELLPVPLPADPLAHATTPTTPTPLPVARPALRPGEEPADGAVLLDLVRTFVRRFAILPPGADVMLATFIIYSYAVEQFDVAPYLALLSPLPESGKTRILELLELLTYRPWLTTVPTTAVLFRKLDRDHPLLLLDEAECVRGRGDRADDIRALLNSGYRRGPKIERCIGDRYELRSFDAFGPKVFACIGHVPPTLFSRCITVPMQRRRRDEPLERFQFRRADREAEPLRRQLGTWANEHAPTLPDRAFEPPEFLGDREAESWSPLFAIALAVGGPWPARLFVAAQQLAAAHGDDGVLPLLLADIRESFAARRVQRLATADLLEDLRAREAQPWGDWKGRGLSPHGLAGLLKPLGIVPTSVRVGDRTPRGYRLEQFVDVFARYLPDPSGAATPQQAPETLDDLGKTDPQQAPGVADANPEIVAESRHCCGVAAAEGVSAREATWLAAPWAQGPPAWRVSEAETPLEEPPPEADREPQLADSALGLPPYPPAFPGALRGDAWEPE